MGRLGLALRYTARSLRRGGQRTVLAVFCVAVGVMAVVALRLAGAMITTSLTANVREVLGGDVSVQSTALPLEPAQLGIVEDLRREGLIESYVALGTEHGSVRRPGGHIVQLDVFVVDDPARFPLVGDSRVADPAGVAESALLRPGQLVISPFAAEQIGLVRGSHVQLSLLRGGGGDVAVAGVLRQRVTAGNPAFVYISRRAYEALASTPSPRVGLVDIVQPDRQRAAEAAARLRAALPGATVQTVQDAIEQSTTASTQINQILEIIGLLALLIGGVGIVNTMQVSLRRRRVEIAMLKTAGYRRADLYALFGMEAAVMGLLGGVVGALAGIGVSALVRVLVSRAFLIDIVYAVAPADVVTGLLVGIVTALIFGLLPIVRAAEVRPADVLRESGRPPVLSRVQSAGLYAAVVALFTGLSAGLVGSLTTALLAVVAALLLLALLGGLFWCLVWLISLVPVPERIGRRWVLGSGLALLVGIAAGALLGAIGAVIVLLVLLGIGIVGAPRRVKTAVKLGLRSLGRARARTATTIVALFVGIFTIGLIVVLGQDFSSRITEALDTVNGINVVAVASPRDAATLTHATESLPGETERRVTSDVATIPTAVDGAPIAGAAGPPDAGQSGGDGRRRLGALAGVEGYDLGSGQVPDVVSLLGGGRLDRGDAGSDRVLVRQDLRNAPLFLRAGSRVTLRQPTSGVSLAVTVAGFYAPARIGGGGLRLQVTAQPVLADVSVVRRLAAAATNPDLQTAVSMRLDPRTKAAALRRIEDADPSAFIVDIADLGAVIDQLLSNLVVLLLALASLSVFAGIVIIANAVALAMLERRREIGILKSVGHSSASILAQVLVENALVAAIGAVTAMVMVTLAARALAALVLGIDLPVSAAVVGGCVGGSVVLVTSTAALVALGPTRIRPLEVLRYE